MDKTAVGHIAVGAIVYRRANPDEIFICTKDLTYPHKVWRGCLCLIGGNWMRTRADIDLSPLATFKREVREELSLIKSLQSTEELEETSKVGVPFSYRVGEQDRRITSQNVTELEIVKTAIMLNAKLFDDYIVVVPRHVFLRGDPQSIQDDMVILLCVFEVPLAEDVWALLVRLQDDFGNLSCESESRILFMEEMVACNVAAVAGHDVALQQFFEAKGISGGCAVPIDEDIVVRRAPMHPLPFYKDYLRYYDIAQ